MTKTDYNKQLLLYKVWLDNRSVGQAQAYLIPQAHACPTMMPTTRLQHQQLQTKQQEVTIFNYRSCVVTA